MSVLREGLPRIRVLAVSMVFVLGGCVKVWPDVYTEGNFVGTFTGYVELEDGTPIALKIVTSISEKSQNGYMFVGEALYGEKTYRVEGEERSDDKRVHYQALPPPHAFVVASLFDESDAARYHLELHLLLIDRWPNDPDPLEGLFSDAGGVIGTVRLRQLPQ